MVNSAKGFLKINKYSASKLTFVKAFSNVFYNVNQGVDSGVGFTKIELSDVDLVESIEKTHESRAHRLLKDFSMLDSSDIDRWLEISRGDPLRAEGKIPVV